MTLLTAPELASLRSIATSALPGTAVIQTQAWVSDGGGGGTTSWTASGTVNCRIAPVVGPGMEERETGDRITADTQYIVTVPSDTAVTTNSRLLITDENVSGTFNVEAIRERSWNVTTRLEVKQEV